MTSTASAASTTLALNSASLYIAISGLIGAGKSTLAERLGARMKLPVYKEPVEQNPYLDKFYGNMAAHAFQMQIYLLNERFKQQQQIAWRDEGAVQDRSIYEDTIFALMLTRAGLMSELDYQTYTALFRNMSNFMRRPTLIVYLDVSPQEALRRIQERQRACEASITLEYLSQLHAAYEEFLAHISRTIPVLRINYNQFPTTEEMAALIEKYYEHRNDA